MRTLTQIEIFESKIKYKLPNANLIFQMKENDANLIFQMKEKFEMPWRFYIFTQTSLAQTVHI